MDYNEMLMHGAAGLQGMSQGMMSPRAAQKFNAGAGGYQDLAKRQMWADNLNEMRLERQSVGGDDDASRRLAELRARRPSQGASQFLGQPSNQSAPGKSDPGGSFMKGLGAGASMFGGGMGGM